MKRAHLTAITGGIGAGKSVVSKILRTMGYQVFDCDIEAKRLMDSSTEIKLKLKTEISAAAVDYDGNIDRKHLSSVVFADPAKLERLNSIVHKAVRDEIKHWANNQHANSHLFVETAILYQSQLDKDVDDVWEVIAPEEIRIIRVMNRNRCTREEVISRIKSQSYTPQMPHSKIAHIINDDFTPILPQLSDLLSLEQ